VCHTREPRAKLSRATGLLQRRTRTHWRQLPPYRILQGD
jgi:hypothetical protein